MYACFQLETRVHVNLAQKNNNPDFSSGVDGFLRLLTSYSLSITTTIVKKEYKFKPRGGGKSRTKKCIFMLSFSIHSCKSPFPLAFEIVPSIWKPLFSKVVFSLSCREGSLSLP
jgi:hypothetical protein